MSLCYYPTLKEFMDQTGIVLFDVPLRPTRVCGPIAYTTSSDDTIMVRCRADFSEYHYDHDYEPNYKVSMVPVSPGFSREDFYCSDFMSLMEREVIHPILIAGD